MQNKITSAQQQEIHDALLALGYPKKSAVRVSPTAPGHVRVAVNGVAIGIYDLNRHTFVD